MEKGLRSSTYFSVLILGLSLLLLGAMVTKGVVSQASAPGKENKVCIIIDAGHGGEDGGAVSCTGAPEKDINLAISLKLRDVLHLLGYETKMLRTEDTDLHTDGSTISQRKNSDLRQRVKLINQTENALLVSIHQNQFPDARYSGAQVFWAKTGGSKELAQKLQERIVYTVNKGSRRLAKEASGVYILEHIKCEAVLVECGFLSNQNEEALLRDDGYQIKFVSILASVISCHLESSHMV